MIIEPQLGDFHLLYKNKCWVTVRTYEYVNIKSFKFKAFATFFGRKCAKTNNTKFFIHNKTDRIVKIIDYTKTKK